MSLDNKWLRGAIPALLIHCCIGSVYCWSLLKEPIAMQMGIHSSEIEFAFSLAIFFLGMSAAFCGRFIEKNVKYSSLISCICFSGGLLLTTIAMHISSVVLLYLAYGCIMGIGLGIGYLSPVKTLMLWFSKHKGLATGIAISGFGLSKAILSPFIEWSNTNCSIYITIWVIALISMLSMLIASLLIKKPGWWIEEKSGNNKETFTLYKSLFKNLDYIKIWFIFYLNITCGLALITFEKGICGTYGITAIGIIAAMTAIFNTLGRFGYSTLSDYVKNKASIYSCIMYSSVVACLLFCLLNNFAYIGIIVITMLCAINAGYGGGFSSLPPLLQSRFGMKNISTIHGLTLSAWAFAGLSGNQLSNLILNKLNLDYVWLVCILDVLYIVSLILSQSLICSYKNSNK